jgi:16S rRNA (guanine527-N7)-methyltransferase
VAARKLRDRILHRAHVANLDLAEDALAGLEAYYQELARWNARINLTAFSLAGGGTDAAIDRLLIEPVLAARFIPEHARSLLDAGSGGGSPAVPLKLARPELVLHMVEAKVRKSVFLRQVTRLLELSEVHVHTARFEELLTRADLHEGVSVVSVRAVRLDPQTLTMLQAVLRPGGLLMSFGSHGQTNPAPPPLIEAGVHDLISSSGSRLRLLHKAFVGGFVPRETDGD